MTATTLGALTTALYGHSGPALAGAANDGATQSKEADTEDSPVPAIAAKWASAWSGTDPNQLAKLFTVDGVYTDLALGRVFRGPSEVAAWKSGTDQLIANVHVEVLDAFRGGDRVAIETVYSGQVRGAPRPFAVRGTTILILNGDLISSNTDNYSLSTLLSQSGLPADWVPPGQ
ncbi:nuclear transport factor 2 family protein [Diaminobutyricibacter sp. McL0618]|uniref:nuclear transport factor 2 family protein n=1 Tax=Leifsonia sp. McL0618 TaxID=3415677 RepID=UPI003CE80EBF